MQTRLSVHGTSNNFVLLIHSFRSSDLFQLEILGDFESFDGFNDGLYGVE